MPRWPHFGTIPNSVPRSLAAVWTYDMNPSEKIYKSLMQPMPSTPILAHIPAPGRKSLGTHRTSVHGFWGQSLSLAAGLSTRFPGGVNIRFAFKSSTYRNSYGFSDSVISFFLIIGIWVFGFDVQTYVNNMQLWFMEGNGKMFYQRNKGK